MDTPDGLIPRNSRVLYIPGNSRASYWRGTLSSPEELESCEVIWGCDHFHSSPGEASACARDEVMRRAFQSEFALKTFVPGMPAECADALLALDEDFQLTEIAWQRNYDGPGAHELTDDACVRIYNAYFRGLRAAEGGSGSGSGRHATAPAAAGTGPLNI